MQEQKIPDFDPDMRPQHPTNRQAAKDRGLHWSSTRQAYVDVEGALVRDRFGQPY